MEKLYFITGHLTIDSFSIKVKEIKLLNETPDNFIVELSNGKNKMIKKNRLLIPETILLEKTNLISYYTYALEKDIDKAKEILLSKIEEILKQLSSNISTLQENFDNNKNAFLS